MSEARTVQERLRAYRELCKNDRKVWSPSTVWRHFDEAADRIDALERVLKNTYHALVYCEANALSPNDVLRTKVEATLKAADAFLGDAANAVTVNARAALHPSDNEVKK